MLLQTSVEDRKEVMPLDSAAVGQYVLVRGDSCYRHSSLPEAKWHSPACDPPVDLEEWRSGAEELRAPFKNETGQPPMVYLLMVQLPTGDRAAALADLRWINDGVIPRKFHRPWTIFGTLEDKVGDIPLITPIHVVVEHPPN
jgi:hypothetical protein